MNIYNKATPTTSQNDDILASVRHKLIEEGQSQLAKVPKDLETDFKKQGSWVGAVSGAATGAALGGLAGATIPELGLVMAIPAAVVAGIIGYFGGAKVGSKTGKNK